MQNNSILCVANWDSDVGYAWWLMESFWVKIASHFQEYDVIVSYPSISEIPQSIKESKLKIQEVDFTFNRTVSIFTQLKFLKTNRVKTIYYSDRANINWRYFLYRLVGVRKIIVHDHTPGLRTKPTLLKKLIKWIINRLPFITSDASIGATEFVKKRLIEVNGIPKIKCFAAPNGIPFKEVSTTQHEHDKRLLTRFGIAENRKVIVSVGRANLYKGIDFALQILKVLLDDYKQHNVHLLYLGDGPDLKAIQQLAVKLGIEEHVSFPGRVNDVDEILGQCQIAFHPSKGEVGYSLSILEYMQAALPVVVSDNPSVCEATSNNETGLIYKEGDVQEAAKAINYLIVNNKKAIGMGNKAKRKVIEDYSLENCHSRLIQTLQQVIVK